MSKAADKIRNLTPEELKREEREQMDQLFRLKFQMKMGQTESLNKVRALRRNVARIKTLRRQHELGLATGQPKPAAATTATKPKAAKKAAGKAGKK